MVSFDDDVSDLLLYNDLALCSVMFIIISNNTLFCSDKSTLLYNIYLLCPFPLILHMFQQEQSKNLTRVPVHPTP